MNKKKLMSMFLVLVMLLGLSSILHATQYYNAENCPTHQEFVDFLFERFGVADEAEWEYLVVTGQISIDDIWEYRLLFFPNERRRGDIDACCHFPNVVTSRTFQIPLIPHPDFHSEVSGFVWVCSNCIAIHRAFHVDMREITHLLRPGTPWWMLLRDIGIYPR